MTVNSMRKLILNLGIIVCPCDDIHVCLANINQIKWTKKLNSHQVSRSKMGFFVLEILTKKLIAAFDSYHPNNASKDWHSLPY